MLSEEKDVLEEETSVAEENEINEIPKVRMITEEEFDDCLHPIKISPEMQDDLYKNSRIEYVLSIIRHMLIYSIIIILLLIGFTRDGINAQVPFLVLAVGTFYVANSWDLFMAYSSRTVNWYKEKGIEKAYLTLVTGKGQRGQGSKRSMLLELSGKYAVRIIDPGVYSSIDRGNVVMILVKNDDYRVVELEQILKTRKAR